MEVAAQLLPHEKKFSSTRNWDHHRDFDMIFSRGVTVKSDTAHQCCVKK